MRVKWFLAGLGILAVCVAVQADPRSTSLAVTDPVSDDNGANETITVPLALPADATSLDMMRIPHGSFTMGSPTTEQHRDSDETQHDVTISRDFYIGKYEVTNAQFRAFRSGHDSSIYDGLILYEDNHPVVYVSWNDATAFCAWLTAEYGSAYPGMIFRLPTESEWEYACRAGTTARCYWGEDPNRDQACGYANGADLTAKGRWSNWTVWNCSDGFTKVARVGKFKPNPFGLRDMIGNVWEWCNDWYGTYPSGPVADPIGQHSGSHRVLRGGSWSNLPGYCRSAARSFGEPDDVSYDLGFRVVLSSRTP
ncbi:MAG TPA: formylglycine-generating enzyme family protein [bacterium]|nr:formylglycine-generating enzyme family protein [bacterium]